MDSLPQLPEELLVLDDAVSLWRRQMNRESADSGCLGRLLGAMDEKTRGDSLSLLLSHDVKIVCTHLAMAWPGVVHMRYVADLLHKCDFESEQEAEEIEVSTTSGRSGTKSREELDAEEARNIISRERGASWDRAKRIVQRLHSIGLLRHEPPRYRNDVHRIQASTTLLEFVDRLGFRDAECLSAWLDLIGVWHRAIDASTETFGVSQRCSVIGRLTIRSFLHDSDTMDVCLKVFVHRPGCRRMLAKMLVNPPVGKADQVVREKLILRVDARLRRTLPEFQQRKLLEVSNSQSHAARGIEISPSMYLNDLMFNEVAPHVRAILDVAPHLRAILRHE